MNSIAKTAGLICSNLAVISSIQIAVLKVFIFLVFAFTNTSCNNLAAAIPLIVTCTYRCACGLCSNYGFLFTNTCRFTQPITFVLGLVILAISTCRPGRAIMTRYHLFTAPNILDLPLGKCLIPS
ncbi:hypothetical protein CLV32_0029 [Pedobacter duraquae]|uniref:Uncharacterized protein n=1 Tax=Pedobacter duraquae TaxID=425511 RepID=A0A4R6INC2_9SPHI|nr:hypothetical protein CLV32_0029 [Pedobacter duraquae]